LSRISKEGAHYFEQVNDSKFSFKVLDSANFTRKNLDILNMFRLNIITVEGIFYVLILETLLTTYIKASLRFLNYSFY